MATEFFNIDQGTFSGSGALTGSEKNGTAFTSADIFVSESDFYRIVFAGTLKHNSEIPTRNNVFGFYVNSAETTHSVRPVRNAITVVHPQGSRPTALSFDWHPFHIEEVIQLSASDVVRVFASGSEITELNIVSASLMIEPNAASYTTQSLLGTVFAATGSFGFLQKAAGTFRIPHPDPELTEDKYLVHSFVESPTAGDNIYRYTVDVKTKRSSLKLPKYFKHLNENTQVWISSVDMLSLGTAKISKDLKNIEILVDKLGTYNVLVIGTRKDSFAKEVWHGPERDRLTNR